MLEPLSGGRTVRLAVVQIVETLTTNGGPVSTTTAVRALRTSFPDIDRTDEQLIELIAETACAKGYTVYFGEDPARGSKAVREADETEVEKA